MPRRLRSPRALSLVLVMVHVFERQGRFSRPSAARLYGGARFCRAHLAALVHVHDVALILKVPHQPPAVQRVDCPRSHCHDIHCNGGGVPARQHRPCGQGCLSGRRRATESVSAPGPSSSVCCERPAWWRKRAASRAAPQFFAGSAFLPRLPRLLCVNARIAARDGAPGPRLLTDTRYVPASVAATLQHLRAQLLEPAH